MASDLREAPFRMLQPVVTLHGLGVEAAAVVRHRHEQVRTVEFEADGHLGGMRVLGLSIITDQCLPDALESASLEQIIKVARNAEPKLSAVVKGVVARL